MTEAWIPQDVDQDLPSAARVYDFLLGGAHNFAIDRAVGQQILKVLPNGTSVAASNRAFMRRAVLAMLELGITQFLDLGSGIPTVGNVHEIAHAEQPDARVVYVDYDEVAVAHSELMLADEPNAMVLNADLGDPDQVLNDPGLRRFLDFDKPIGLLMVAVFHFVADDRDPAGIVARYRDALPEGSLLALSHLTADHAPEEMAKVTEAMKNSRDPMYFRAYDDVRALFDGFELLPPGLVTAPQWRPDLFGDEEVTGPDDVYVAVGKVVGKSLVLVLLPGRAPDRARQSRGAGCAQRARRPACRRAHHGDQGHRVALAVGHHGGQRGDHRVVRPVHRRGDRHGDQSRSAVADGVAVAPDTGEHVPQLDTVGDGEVGEPVQRARDDRLLQVGGGVREQHEPDAGGVRREPAADPGEHVHGAAPGDPFQEHDLRPVEHGELHVVAGRLVEVLEEGQRALPQADPARRERGDLPQPQPDPVPAVGTAFERARRGQLADEAVRRGERQAGAPADLGQGEQRRLRAERAEHRAQPCAHAGRHQASLNHTGRGGKPGVPGQDERPGVRSGHRAVRAGRGQLVA